MKKRKKRSIATSRAASLKGWRSRKKMQEGRMTINTKPLFLLSGKRATAGDLVVGQAYLIDPKTMTLKPVRTIDLIPKVTWP